MSLRSLLSGSRAASHQGARGLPRLSAVLALGLAGAACSGCDDPGGAPGVEETLEGAAWPEDAVLAVNDLPITAQEVDRIAEAIGEVSPEYTRPHLRRLALTNVVLERAACRSLSASARELALTDCTRARSALTDAGGPPPRA